MGDQHNTTDGCEAVDLRADRQAGRAICFNLLKVLVEIPENFVPGTTHLLPEQEKERERKRKARQKDGSAPNKARHPVMPLRSANGVALPFPCRFSLPRSLSCVDACFTGPH